MDTENIGFLGGFPLEMDDEDRPVGTASIWMPEDDADVTTLVSDLLRDGIPKEHGPGLIEALCHEEMVEIIDFAQDASFEGGVSSIRGCSRLTAGSRLGKVRP